MKRFVVITYDLFKFTNITLLRDQDSGEVLVFPRRKEAEDHIQDMNSEYGFSYKVISLRDK